MAERKRDVVCVCFMLLDNNSYYYVGGKQFSNAARILQSGKLTILMKRMFKVDKFEIKMKMLDMQIVLCI